MDKKNLLIIISSLTGGGAELVVANLCKYLNREKFNVTICHLKERGHRGASLAEAGYDVVGLNDERPGKTNYLSFLKLRKLIRQKKIDIVHTHSTDALIDSSLCKLFFPRLRLIHTFHYGNYPNYNKRYLFLEKRFQYVPDKLVAVGIEQRKMIQKTFGIPDARIMTIWNGVEIEDSQADRVLLDQFTTSGKVLIGSISTFIEQKGLFVLLEVIYELKKSCNNFVCIIVGDGPLRAQLEERRHELDLEKSVYFLGWVEKAASRVLPGVDIFVQSSLWEAMSIVVLEAMAVGKAAVVTDVGDNKYMIESGKNGIIVKKNDVVGMKEVLERLVKNRILREELGRHAREKVMRECRVSQMARNYESLYLELLE